MQIIENDAGPFEQRAAVDGGLDAPRRPVEQPHAEGALHVGDDLRHRGLGEGEVGRRLRHALALRYRHKRVQFAQLQPSCNVAIQACHVGYHIF